MVKGTDLKSVVHSTREFKSRRCRSFFKDTVAEWLRRRTANPFPYGIASSNLVGVVFFGDVDQLVDRSLCMREVGGSKPPISIMPD